jgi:nicotinamidase/pyrazinamidase
VLWPDHCIQGSFGAQFHADINQDAAALILRKGGNPLIDSYSAFFENDHLTATGLHGYLQNCGVSALDMVGLATDFCVNYSAVDAAKLGYSVRVLLGACRGIDVNGSLAAAQRDMRDAGVRLEAGFG